MQYKLSGRVENCVLSWFGHVKRMDDERMAKRVYDFGVRGRRGRGDQRESRWMVWRML